jgi:hypothetical protein
MREGQEIGLGSVLKKVTSAIGVKPCGGCNKRAERLDDMLTLRGRRR